MESLSDSIKFMEDYLKQKSQETAAFVKGTNMSKAGDPLSSLQGNLQDNVIANVKSSIATNPIAQTGIDTLTEMGTTVAQKLVTNAFKKINFSPIQNAVQSFFQAWATVSTFDKEIAMELARNTGRNINSICEKKKSTINSINADLVAMHNACIIILNSSPFLDQYIQNMISAYKIILSADDDFNSVLRGLANRSSSAASTVGPLLQYKALRAQGTFQSKKFDGAVAKLQQAQALLLPDRNIDVTSIRGVTDFASATISRQTNLQAMAAVQALPGISLRLGQHMIEYARQTSEINLLLITFSDALEGYISSYSANDNINQVIVDHITSGVVRLEELSGDMKAALFPNLSENPSFDPTLPTYGPKLSAQATGWGIKLQTIIEWMKLNPGKGQILIDKTTNSVAEYLLAVDTLKSLGNRSYSGGTLLVSKAQEAIIESVGAIAKLILRANTIVGTQQTRTSVTTEFSIVRKLFETSRANVSAIQSALAPFLATQNTLPGPARQILTQALGIANKYGLDRIVGLINDGKVRELFKVSAETATFSGAAVFGMNQLLGNMQASPTATDAQIEKITDLRDTVQRDQTTKGIEANRSYSSSVSAAQEELKATLSQIKATIFSAREAAKQLDSASVSEETATETRMANIIPGFNANKALAGLE